MAAYGLYTHIASNKVRSMLLLGGLFRSVGTPDVPLFAQSPEKRRHTLVDLGRQAELMTVLFPPVSADLLTFYLPS